MINPFNSSWKQPVPKGLGYRLWVGLLVGGLLTSVWQSELKMWQALALILPAMGLLAGLFYLPLALLRSVTRGKLRGGVQGRVTQTLYCNLTN